METTFAKINAFGDVQNVIVAEQSYIDSLVDSTSYVQTWADASGEQDKRFNYASIGGKFDAANNAFIAKQPFNSWKLDAKFQWQAPFPMPAAKADVFYTWDESAVDWKELPVPATV
jgi:hypothetical protein